MQTNCSLPLRIALLSEREDLFTLSSEMERKVEQRFSKLESAIDLIAKTPVRALTRKLSPSGRGVTKKLHSLLEIVKNLFAAASGYETFRTAMIADSLYVSLLFSYLRSLQLPLAEISVTSLSNGSLPYEKLEKLPEWAEYLSHLYSPTLSRQALQEQVTLSRTIQNHLDGEDKVRLALLDLSTILGMELPAGEAYSLIQEREKAYANITLYRGASRRKSAIGSTEKGIAAGFRLIEKRQQIQSTDRCELLNKKSSGLFEKPETEFDVGYHLAKLLEIDKEHQGNVFSEYKNALKHSFLVPRIDALFPRISQIVFSKLRSTLGQLSRNPRTITEQTFAQFKQLEVLSKQLEVLSKQIEKSKQTLFTPERLRALTQQPFAHTDALFSLTLVKISIAFQQTLISQLISESKALTQPIFHANFFEPLLRVQSTLSALVPTRPPTFAKRKSRRTKKTRKPLKSAPIPTAQEVRRKEVETVVPVTPPPAATLPTVIAEAKHLAKLAQMPIRIQRHPRTYNRFEFDRRNQILHHLPPQLVQMLLRKEDAFIAKYVRRVESDPLFHGDCSVRTTVLCHDRNEPQIYIGELSIGIAPNGLIYHIYINPYVNPLGERELLEQSVIERPSNDQLEEEQGFTPVGNCQMSYNELLCTIDVADRGKNCLYRVFLQQT